MERNRTNTIRSLIAVVVFALLSGCASMPSIEVPIFDDFRVEYGGGD